LKLTILRDTKHRAASLRQQSYLSFFIIYLHVAFPLSASTFIPFGNCSVIRVMCTGRSGQEFVRGLRLPPSFVFIHTIIQYERSVSLSQVLLKIWGLVSTVRPAARLRPYSVSTEKKQGELLLA